jgi:uncharacterized repeat protein (TIGR03803 family)
VIDTAGRENVLYNFMGASDAGGPTCELLPVGNVFYGTSDGGGAGCSTGCGTVFAVDTAGREAVLYRFSGGQDGAIPVSTFVHDSAGNLYGTTQDGGDTSCNAGQGCGTVFKLDLAGTESVLHRFSEGTDGQFPEGDLLEDAVGNLYGTTFYGGDPSCSVLGEVGCGMVFKIDPAGNETVLHRFSGPDGSEPMAGLLMDAAGNLYGTTCVGGDLTCNTGVGCGTIFELDAAGNETVLYSFTGNADGSGGAKGVYPFAGLVQDEAGNLYGTTYEGGDLSCSGGYGCGTVFELDTAGNLTVLHPFTGTDGEYPYARLLRTGRGALYGTTFGGTSNFGVVLGIKPY